VRIAIREKTLTVDVAKVFLQVAQRPGTVFSKAEDVAPNLACTLANPSRYGFPLQIPASFPMNGKHVSCDGRSANRTRQKPVQPRKPPYRITATTGTRFCTRWSKPGAGDCG